MTRDFAIPLKAASRKKLPVSQKRQSSFPSRTSRRLVGFLLAATVGASLFLWQKERVSLWWQTVWGPAEYEIINPEIVDSELIRLTENLHRPSDVVSSIKQLTAPLQGTYGVYAEPLRSGEPYGLNQDQVFTAASVNKVLIMAKILQKIDAGEVSFADTYRLQAKDVQDYGTGSMRYAALGTSYTVDELLTLSGKQSDNTAAWVLSLMLGQDEVQQLAETLGMEQTLIEDNTTTPAEMGSFFARIYKETIIPAGLREKFYGYLTHTDFEDRISAGVPGWVTVAHKIGNEIQTVNDCGIVFNKKYPYVLCIFSKEAQEDEALKVIPKISHLVWSYESARP